FPSVYTAAIRFDPFPVVTAPHPDDNRMRHDRVRQPAQPRHRYSGIGRNFLGLDRLATNYTPTGNRASAVASVKQAAKLFIFTSFWSKYGVDFIVEQRHTVLVSDFPKKVGGAYVDGSDRIRH